MTEFRVIGGGRDVIETLEAALAMAKAGEIEAVMIATVNIDGCQYARWSYRYGMQFCFARMSAALVWLHQIFHDQDGL